MHRYKTQAQAHKPDLTLPVDYKPTITCKYKALKTAAFIYFTTITITFVILQWAQKKKQYAQTAHPAEQEHSKTCSRLQ